MTDEFSAPVQTGDPRAARPRLEDLNPNLAVDVAGRLLLIRPTKLERNVPSKTQFVEVNGQRVPKTQDRVTADIIVLDGGPLNYGGKPEKGEPHTVIGAPVGPGSPAHLGVFISNTVLVAQLEASVPSGKVLGRLTKVPTKQNPAWKLLDPTEADRELARAWIAQDRAATTVLAAPAATVAPAPPAPTMAPPPPPAPAYAPPPPPAPPAPALEPIACPPTIDPAWFAAQPREAQAYYAAQYAATQAGAAPAPAVGAQANWS